MNTRLYCKNIVFPQCLSVSTEDFTGKQWVCTKQANTN